MTTTINGFKAYPVHRFGPSDLNITSVRVEFSAGDKYYKLSPKSILELDGEIRCYYEGNSLDPNCAACKILGRFSYCNSEFVF